ncbi:aldo/keto reductase [Xanthobacter pseudotagetidis]|uniref:aldo/keto reductase n=1 Tax=Xanthobacter pseudotagetidis TaxID=3119911 RepID=UPI003727E8A8
MPLTRRRFLELAPGAALAALPTASSAQPSVPLARVIPSSGEAVPAVGLGTWITFNVGDDPVLRGECAEVMSAFFAAGGTIIDSSPMYGSSQPVVGYGLAQLKPQRLFTAEKVWTSGASAGAAQIERSRQLWGVPRFDLLQVHNLLDWQVQLPRLQAMKSAGQVRYVGITTSEGRRHAELERIMRGQRLDFVQLSYNVLDREAEARLLPLAAERGIAVLVNRPFRQGALTRALARAPLPGWAGEIGATSWAQALLKFILAHPAVTAAIPATTRVDHVRENLAAASGPLPDRALRERMSAYVRAL